MPSSISFPVLTLDELQPALKKHAGGADLQFSHATALGKATATSGATPVPANPGCYVWTCGDDAAVAYIGSAASLAKRLGGYRDWLHDYDPDAAWDVTVVHMLHRLQATVQWVVVGSWQNAVLLERRLIEWHRACTGVAPPVVGWEAKPTSPRGEAEDWARGLYRDRRRQGIAEGVD